MSLLDTVPQVFYDLIARAIPGFLFLLVLHLQLAGTRYSILQLLAPLENSMVALLIGIAYGVLCYLVGWVLYSFTFRSAEAKVRKAHEQRLGEDAPSLAEMYHKIRLKDKVAGFRIVKLRAEARMLETSRSGMVYALVFACALLALDLRVQGWSAVSGLAWVDWVLRLGVPIILAIAFWRCERRAWDSYYGNVQIHYEILYDAEARKQQNGGVEGSTE